MSYYVKFIINNGGAGSIIPRGLSEGLPHAGSKSVLASLWSVAETSTVTLVERFFLYLKDGKDKSTALRMARNDIREIGYDHPFFWAPFILTGESR